ncbi:non-ribosomal peptide synthetase [Acanthopleuribacter pedis]|uniref:Amino acid adenylation domain-containing protein n=1 Tax=Acanthopleuribacter pedis TaxID=442870 RepID=A0A8J7U365_9BACT|nr:non-ribosomal peptide synthetase [Acanthopleuribacter pedis]MBO1319307.1 amino acid adenylation domain-containing protein [Acanthopleuribacter pedis]
MNPAEQLARIQQAMRAGNVGTCTQQQLERISRDLKNTTPRGQGPSCAPAAGTPRAVAQPAQKPARTGPELIAIIGCAGFLPQSASVRAFWQALDADRALIETIPATRFDWRTMFAPGEKSDSRWGGFVPNPRAFDPHFFGILPADAELMDPRQRLLFTAVYQTLEDAGYAPTQLKQSRTGVFVALEDNDYAHLLAEQGLHGQGPDQSACLLPNRLSYHFDWRGPSEVVDTMCSGAAVALHRAVCGLRLGQMDTAVVAAANVILRPEPFITLSRLGHMSPEPTVRSFGADARGHVRAEAAISLLLKPLSRAEADGDHIYALIRNTAVNYNGRGGTSMAAPNPSAHADVIRDCYRGAAVDVRRIGYIEAQGMGNPVADLAEWRATNRALRDLAAEQGVTLPAGNCRVGTLKPMTGHMEAASALGALLKIIRTFHTDTAHQIRDLVTPHPDLDCDGTPCRLLQETESWPEQEQPRLAGLHAYGTGGNNAHILVEEYRAPQRAAAKVATWVAPLSAAGEGALDQRVADLKHFLTEEKGVNPADLAFTLQHGRTHMEYRAAFIAPSRAALIATMDAYLAGDPTVRAEAASHQAWRQAVPPTAAQRAESVRRLPLPVYGFETQDYWFDQKTPSTASQTTHQGGGEIRVRDYLVAKLAELLRLPPEHIKTDKHLHDYGIDSLKGTDLIRGLEKTFGCRIQGRDLLAHPAVNDLAAFVAGQASVAPASLLEAAPAAAEEPRAFPLSANQRGLWLLQKQDPHQTAYNFPLGLRLCHRIEVARFRQACAFLLAQHPILSHTFTEQDGTLVQRANPAAPVPLQQEDLSHLNADQVQALLRERARIPFDLAEDLPIRCFLFQRDSEWIVLLVLHHIVTDGFSIPTLYATLLDAYQSLLRGDTPDPVRSADQTFQAYVAREETLLAGNAGTLLRDWWHQQLAGRWPRLNLASEQPHPDSAATRGAVHQVTLGPESARALTLFARAARVNPAPLFLALLQTLLYRTSGQKDLVVGMPARSRPEGFENTIGYFTNLLPIRAHGFAGRSFSNLLQQTQLAVLDALDHEALPFPEIVRGLAVERHDLGPIFQVLFEYQNFFSEDDLDQLQARYPEMKPEFLTDLHQEGEAPLTLEVVRGTAGFLLNFKYDPALFSEARIQRFAEHYRAVAEAVVADPGQPLEALPLFSAAERQERAAWNPAETAYPRRGVHELFADQAARRPDAPALQCGETELSYATLNRRTDQLAGYLQTLGVKAGTRVAVCIGRSEQVVVAMLAVLKAGGAYVPLDPNFPENRLTYMLEDSDALMVLTEARHRAKVTELLQTQIPVLALDTEWPLITAANRPPAPVLSGADHPAYVIYTSGSSGQPKGVIIPHRALTNFLCSMAETPGITAGDRLLAVTTVSFDIAGLELFLPLIRGAVCLLCPEGIAADAEQLKNEIARSKPTLMQATPTTWSMLFHAGWRNAERVRLLCGGEPLPESLRRRFLAADSEVWNVYGPTETTIWSSLARLREEGPIHIGTPLANTEIFILGHHLAEMPAGAAGELCIAGDGLADGYHNRPDLTADRFVPHPFRAGQRLYRTGDLARRLPDGSLEHLGRMDFQVKVRGYRIEPAEIEARLAQHPGVRECVVVAREDQGSSHLVAWYQPAETAPDSRALAAHLAADLPAYMIPALFLPRARLPRTNNGKTDRKALMECPLVAVEESTSPQTEPLEQAVLAIWRAVLPVPVNSTDEGFFEMGGDSYRAVLLAERISETFAIHFTTTDLFRHTSVRAMAKHIAACRPAVPTAPAPPVVAVENVKPHRPNRENDSLAVIGISCHFPDAADHHQFWQNLRAGHDSARFLNPAELRAAGVDEALINSPDFVPLQQTITDKYRFDNDFFRISHKNARAMDPQMRHLLQHAWATLEDAGYTPEAVPETGVYIATSNSFYQAPLYQGAVDLYDPDAYVAWVLAQPGAAATMIAYQLNLHGPAYAVHANCSSSLVGLHAAWQSLQLGETRQALVGAASLMPANKTGYRHRAGLNFAADGRCKAFDAAADGMVGGEGVAVVLLKRTADALADGDHIYALLRGIALNNDGRDKAGFYAPSIQGQAEVIRKALGDHIDPATIGYVEAHGTGTRLGDPIEIAALTEAWNLEQRQTCGIGSVKSNIGHLDTAAGLAGLVKVAMSLYHGELAPTLHVTQPNPAIDFAATPFYVVDSARPWPKTTGPRRAALSSFGLGGTNTHAVLEAAPPNPTPKPLDGPFLLVFSAADDDRLRTRVALFRDFIAHQTDLDLGAVAYTLQVGRKAMASRLALVVDDATALRQKLDAFLADGDTGDLFLGTATMENAPIPKGAKNNRNLKALAKQWVTGMPVAWADPYPEPRPRRVSLPTYPFAGEFFDLAPKTTAPPAPRLHPLLHRENHKNGAHYCASFHGCEPFLTDHRVNGQPVLPGVAYLEMARFAANHRQAFSNPKLRNVVWMQPLTVATDPQAVRLRLIPEGDRLRYVIEATRADGESVTHGQGLIEPGQPDAAPPPRDLTRLQREINHRRFSAQTCYAAFAEHGIHYGPSHRGLVWVAADAAEPTRLLAKLHLTELGDPAYVLHPGLLDAAVQASIAFDRDTPNPVLTLPYALAEVDRFRPCTNSMWAVLQRRDPTPEAPMDIELLDDHGRVCVVMKALVNRPVAANQENTGLGEQLHLETPVWDVVKPEISVPSPAPTLLVGGSTRQQRELLGKFPDLRLIAADELVAVLSESNTPVAHLVWIAADEAPAAGQTPAETAEAGILRLFRLVKTLLSKGYGARKLTLTLVTSAAVSVFPGEAVDPTFATVHGFGGALAREFRHWHVRLLDVAADTPLPETLTQIQPAPRGATLAYRAGQWFAPRLEPVRDLGQTESDPYREGGVYVVVGGAGGIGAAWSRRIIASHKAHVYWLGRRPAEATAQARRDATVGDNAPTYIQADAADPRALERARATILKQHPRIDGTIHAALVLDDGSLTKLDEQRFTRVLRARVHVAVHAASVLQPRDFLLFLSSMTSFDRDAGQSNYAAGCTFMDAYAQFLAQNEDALPETCRVRVVNWGYWGSIGAVATPEYRARMHQAGIGSIEPDEGLTLMEHLLRGTLPQLAVHKTTNAETRKTQGFVQAYPETIPSLLAKGTPPKPARLPSPPIQAFDTAMLELLWAVLHPLCPATSFQPSALVAREDATLQRWCAESCRLLAQQGVLEATTSGYRVVRLPAADAWQTWNNRKNTFAADPTIAPQVTLVSFVLEALPDMLAGRRRAHEVLFPKAAMERVEGVYKNNPVADTFNNLLGDALIAWFKQRLIHETCTDCVRETRTTCDRVTPIRILEIGAGTGGTSAGLLPRLQAYAGFIEEYAYTDLSHAFLKHAREHYAPGRPWLKTHLFDASKPLELQNIEPGSYDVVVATNVLHATADIRQTLRNTKAALKKNGVLFLNEISSQVLFDHLTFGLLDGWWLVKDAELRLQGCPGLAPEMWARVLAQEGFNHIGFPAESAHHLGQQLVVAESNGIVRQPLADPQPTVSAQHPQTTVSPQLPQSTVSEQLPQATVSPRSPQATVSPRSLQTTAAAAPDSAERVADIIRASLAEALDMPVARIQDQRGFADIGVDSITAVGIVNHINETCGLLLPTTVLFDYPNVNQLAEFIGSRHQPILVAENTPTDSILPAEPEPDRRARIRDCIAASLEMPASSIRDDRPFSEYGVDSIVAVELVNRINDAFNTLLQTTVLFDHNSVDRLNDHLASLQPGLPTPAPTAMPHRKTTAGAPPITNPGAPPATAPTEPGHFRHLQVRGPGAVDDLVCTTAPCPALGPDEVRIAVKSFSLNFADLLCVRGLYPNMPPYPFTPGDEAAGLVEAVGDAVTRFQPGDAVVCLTPGCHAERVTCPQDRVYPKPAALSFDEACALPMVALTMLQAFRKADLQPGERILIQTAAGGIGLIAVQLAQQAGAEIFATAGSQTKLDYLRELGVHHGINYRETDFEREIQRLTGGEGVDVVINTLAGDAVQKGLNCLGSGGRYIEIAMAALKSARSVDLSVLNRNQAFFSIDLGLLRGERPERIRRTWAEMDDLVARGVLRPTIGRTLPFEHWREAYRALDNRENIGKIVVQVPATTAPTDNHTNHSTNSANSRARRESAPSLEPIAIIGVSARFAQSPDVDAFWRHLAAGDNLVEKVTRWDLGPENPARPRCRHGSFLEDYDQFDAGFFNISEEEALYMDPQQRLFLEETWKALENAGHCGEAVRGSRCSVYVGAIRGDYPQLFRETPPAHAFWGNEASVIPARIAYLLDLHGPAAAVDTACSSSLSAVHYACTDLWTGQAETAVAGGVFIQPTPEFYRASNDADMLSPSGRCYSFDERADGFVPGEGVGALVLKPLSKALADGDHIHGVIHGSGVNQDGATNGLTAPGARSQERLLRAVYQRFGIDPEQITLVDAHGTGTRLGDAIEFEALTRAFDSNKTGFCALGSVKTNIGHASTASGLSGLIKVLSALRHQQIPPSLNFQSSALPIDNSPFFINTTLRDWKVPAGQTRIGAVSSFGFSGTNAHVVLGEAPRVNRRHAHKSAWLIALSARSQAALRHRVADLVGHLEQETDHDLGNISYTLLTGRTHHHHRLACVVRSIDDCLQTLTAWLETGDAARVAVGELPEGRAGRRDERGDQCIKTCRTTVETESLLREVRDRYVQGFRLAYADLFAAGFSKVPLPTYPFERKRYLPDTQPSSDQIPTPAADTNLACPDTDTDEPRVLWLRTWIAAALQQPLERIATNLSFFQMGLDSVQLHALAGELQQRVGRFSTTLLFEYVSIADLANYLAEHHPDCHFASQTGPNQTAPTRPTPKPNRQTHAKRQATAANHAHTGIAVVGMSGAFPNAADLDAFWQNILAGADCITPVPAGRFGEASEPDPAWVGGFLADIHHFDPLFFGISPREAKLMDPQQRLLLRHLWQALEDAAIPPDRLRRRPTGVFTALTADAGYERQARRNDPDAHTLSVPGAAALPNRISQFLDLCGPSSNVESTCSSSLLALHLAVQAVQSGTCDQALVGGVHLILSPEGYLEDEHMGNLSTHGRVRSFQAEGDGYVRGEGVGAVVLKRLDLAEADGDRIHAVIRGTGVAHGGRAMSLTAPNAKGMRRAVANALAGPIQPADLDYIEAHGTGTLLGDSIEGEALQTAYGQQGPLNPEQPIHIGCVKPLIGNSEIASGMAEFLKVVLALRHKMLPGIPGFTQPHPQINLTPPFCITAKHQAWPQRTDASGQPQPRRAGINSYGVSGVNAHLVLEEPPPRPVRRQAPSPPHIIVLSAPSEERLRVAAEQLAGFVRERCETHSQTVFSETLRRETAALLEVDPDLFDPNQPLGELGLDAPQRFMLHHNLCEALDHHLPLDPFTRAETGADLVAALADHNELAQNLSHGETVCFLADLAYTLQIGREPMAHRLALVVTNTAALTAALEQWSTGKTAADCYQGDTETETAPSSVLGLATEQEPARIARHWVQGGAVDWHNEQRPARRIAAPGYPFRKETFPICGSRPQPPAPSPTPTRTPWSGIDWLRHTIAALLDIPADQLPHRKPLFELGFTSLGALSLKAALEQHSGQTCSLAEIDIYASLERLSKQLNLPTNAVAAAHAAVVPEIVPDPAARFEPFPLNDIQESFLLGRNLGLKEDRVGCHIYLELTFTDLNIYRLNQAWQKLIDHHDMLRVVIGNDGTQQVQPTASYRFRAADLRRKTESDRQTQLKTVRDRMAHQVYEVGRHPLYEIRVCLCPDRQIVHFSMDELVVDAAGIDLLFGQWQALYRDPETELPPTEISFRDVVLALKRFEQTPRYREDLAFHLAKRKQHPLPYGPALPLRTHLAQSGNRFSHVTEQLAPHAWHALKQQAARASVSPSALVLGVFTAVLHAWCGPHPFSLILTRANREGLHPDVSRLVGPFISTGIHVTPAQGPLGQVIRETQTRLIEDLDHGSVSGIRLLRELRRRRLIDKRHFLPVVFTSLLGHAPVDGDTGFSRHLSYFQTQTPQVYLDHQIREQDEALVLRFDVIKEYFEPGVVDALFEQYLTVLGRLAAEANWDAAVAAPPPSRPRAETPETPARDTTTFPLTDQQQAYAFGRSQFGAGTNTQVYTSYDAEVLDVPRLERAWARVMAAHDMLTTRILGNGTAQPMAHAEYRIAVTDLREGDASARRAQLAQIETDMMARICPLDSWPYFEIRVSRLPEGWRIHLAVDMIIADGPSIDLLLNDLFAFYRRPDLFVPAPAYRFRDYMAAQSAYRGSEQFLAGQAYWRERFRNMPSGPVFAGKTEGAPQTTQRLTATLDGWSVAREFAERLSVRPGMILLTAFADVLAAHAVHLPFTLVIPCWQRPPLHPAIDEVVGDFTAMSWLVVDQPRGSFEARVRHNHAAVQQDLNHGRVSGLSALRRVTAKRDLAFPVVFTDLSIHPNPELPEGFRAGPSLSRTPNVHLDNISSEHGDRLDLAWDVQPAALPLETATRLFAAYHELLTDLVRDPAASRREIHPSQPRDDSAVVGVKLESAE